MKNNLARSSFVVVVIGIISKIMGTIRTSMIANSFGQSGATDAYYSAYKIAMFSMVLINVTINSCLIPLLAQVEQSSGEKGKNFFFNNFATVSGAFNLFFAAITVLLSPVLSRFILPGASPEVTDLTAQLVRIMAPCVIFQGYINAVGAYHQSRHLFAPYAATGIVNNIVFFIYLVLLGPRGNVIHLAYMTLLGAFVQMLFMMIWNVKFSLKMRFILRFEDQYLKEYAQLAVPLFIASAIDTINNMITVALASHLDEGIITTMDNSYRLFSAILQIFVAAIATVVYPTLSSAVSRKDDNTLSDVAKGGLESILYILMPATVLMILLAEPIVQIVYQRGKFTEWDTYVTQIAFTFYALGLLGHGLKIYFAKIFYSYHDTFVPMLIQAGSILLNIVLAFILVKVMDFRGLALAKSVAGIFGAILMWLLLDNKMPKTKFQGYGKNVIKIIVVSMVMGLLAKIIFVFSGKILGATNWEMLLRLLLSCAGGMFIYILLSFLWNIEAIVLIKKMIDNRRKSS